MTIVVLKPVYVEWVDAQHINASLITVDEARREEPCVARQVGYLVHEDRDKVILADQWWPEYDAVKYLTIIPRSLITQKRTLK